MNLELKMRYDVALQHTFANVTHYLSYAAKNLFNVYKFRIINYLLIEDLMTFILQNIHFNLKFYKLQFYLKSFKNILKSQFF